MLTNYFKIAFRNLVRHKAYSFINVAGLAIGLACTILILLWVQDELSYDRFFPRASHIYRINANLPDLDVHAAVTPTPLAPTVAEELPDVRNVMRISSYYSGLLQVGDRMFEEDRILFVDSNFFEFFPFEFIEGDPASALQQTEGIILTAEMATKYFGNELALGKTIQKDHNDNFTVVGVLGELPSNTHLQFDFLQPMAFLARTNNDLKNDIWDNFNFYSYLEVSDGFQADPASLDDLASQMTDIYKAHENELKVRFSLQPLTAIHLRSKLLADFPGRGNAQYVYIFMIVALFIIAVACINFMNLATARSARRAKEVGLRKVAGAVRFQLIRQFLAESTLVSFIALALAVLTVFATLPLFNDLAGKTLHFDVSDPKILLGLLTITLVTGLFAGSYPALFLSRFLPATVLKGNLKTGAAGSLFRNTMVIIQFSVSIMLLVGTAVIYQQLQFIQNRSLGYDKENLLYVPMNGELWQKYQTFRTALEQDPRTSDFTVVSDLPLNLSNATISVEWEGKDPSTQPLFSNMAIDENFIDVFKMDLLKGRGFSKEFTADTVNLIVNEKALETMGMDLETAVGSSLTMWGNKGTIIGVIKDFNFKPIQQPIEPLILRLNTWGGTAVVRAKAGETESTIEALRNICTELNPGFPFTFNFFDQDLANLYKAESRLSNLFTVFAALAILISALGLYGLSAFLAERRTKEIGVRKVLGASVFHLVYLLSWTFTRPVLAAMLIAGPVAWYAMNKWLDGFAFRIDIHWSIFLLAFVVALAIAWLTVSYESLKAAMSNPAKSLRDE